MKKNSPIQYYVEGEDEKRFLSVLKTELQMIRPGNVQVFNVILQKFTNPRLIMLKPNTVVVLVYDTDTDSLGYLRDNIAMLQTCPMVSEVITIPQCRNLEDELVYASDVRNALNLLNSNGRANFKHDFIHTTNLAKKLIKHQLDIKKLWSRQAGSPFDVEPNMAEKIKLNR